jgi:hypothetical protein
MDQVVSRDRTNTELELEPPSAKLRSQVDAYLVRCAKVNNVAAEKHLKELENRIRNELLPDRLAFRNVRVKANPLEVSSSSLLHIILQAITICRIPFLQTACTVTSST